MGMCMRMAVFMHMVVVVSVIMVVVVVMPVIMAMAIFMDMSVVMFVLMAVAMAFLMVMPVIVVMLVNVTMPIFMVMLVIVVVLVIVTMPFLMVMSVVVAMAIFVIMAMPLLHMDMNMRMLVSTGLIMAVPAAIKIFHIMVVVFVSFIQDHIKIAGIQPRLLHPADLHLKAAHRQTVQNIHQHLFIHAQIQQSRSHHIPADSRITF